MFRCRAGYPARHFVRKDDSMNNRTKVGLAIVTALIIGVGGYFGMGHFSTMSNGQTVGAKMVTSEKFGVIEVMRAVKAHPRYAEIEALEREIKELQKEVQAKIERGMMMSMSSGLPMEVSQRMTAGEQALFAEANQKIAAKETELGKRMAETGLAKQKTADEEREKLRRQITEEYKIRIFNLKMKLQALNLSDEDRASMEQELVALQTEEAVKIDNAERAIMQKLAKEMMAEEQAAIEEMKAYVQQIGEEYSLMRSVKTGQPNDAMMAQINELNRKLKADIAASEKVYAEKRKKQEEIQDAILYDIETKAMQIARERELTIVLRDVRANITAADITDAVIEACKESSKQ